MLSSYCRFQIALLAAALVLPFSANGQDVAEGKAKARFDVWEYRVEGNTVLDAVVIERVVYGQLGPQKTIDDINAARGALEQAYRDAG